MDWLEDLPTRPSSVPPTTKWSEAEAYLDKISQENFVLKLTLKLEALQDNPNLPKLPKWKDSSALYIRGYKEFQLPSYDASTCSTPFSDEDSTSAPQDSLPCPIPAPVTALNERNRKRDDEDGQELQDQSLDTRPVKREKSDLESQQCNGRQHSDHEDPQHAKPPDHKRKRDDEDHLQSQDQSRDTRLMKRAKSSHEVEQDMGEHSCDKKESQHDEPSQCNGKGDEESNSQSEKSIDAQSLKIRGRSGTTFATISTLLSSPKQYHGQERGGVGDEFYPNKPNQHNQKHTDDSDTLSENSPDSRSPGNNSSSASSISDSPSLPSQRKCGDGNVEIHYDEAKVCKRKRGADSEEPTQAELSDTRSPKRRVLISDNVRAELNVSDDYSESIRAASQALASIEKLADLPEPGSWLSWLQTQAKFSKDLPDNEQRYDDWGEALRQEPPSRELSEEEEPQEPQVLPPKRVYEYENFQQSDCRHYHDVDRKCWWVASLNYNWKNTLVA